MFEAALLTCVYVLPGLLISRILLFVSAGWEDPLVRLGVAHAGAAATAAFIVIQGVVPPQTLAMAGSVAAFLLIQMIWLTVDLVRMDLTDRAWRVAGRSLQGLKLRSSKARPVRPAQPAE